jgi:hypothetical protein
VKPGNLRKGNEWISVGSFHDVRKVPNPSKRMVWEMRCLLADLSIFINGLLFFMVQEKSSEWRRSSIESIERSEKF